MNCVDVLGESISSSLFKVSFEISNLQKVAKYLFTKLADEYIFAI